MPYHYQSVYFDRNIVEGRVLDIFMPEKITRNKAVFFVHGSSAGGHLAALLAMTTPGECGEGAAYGTYALKEEWAKPVGASLQAAPLTFEPWEDIFPGSWDAMQEIVGAAYEKGPELYRKVSPVNYLSESTQPIFLLGAENEHMFPLEHNADFVARAASFGCRVEYKVYAKAEHGFFYDVTRRCQRDAFADILTFME